MIAHCASGYRSQIAASLLQAAGFNNVSTLNEGEDAGPRSCPPKARGRAHAALELDIMLGFAIGLSLGLLGGGGSILTVPALVYIVGQNPHAAVTASLVIVGRTALGGFCTAAGHAERHVALTFGGAGWSWPTWRPRGPRRSRPRH